MCYESWETCFWRRDHKLNWCVGTHTLIWGLPFIKQQTFFQRLWRGSLPAKTWPFWEHKRPHPKRRFSTASWLRNVLLHDDISPTGVCADSDLPFKHQRTLFRGEACLQKRPGECFSCGSDQTEIMSQLSKLDYFHFDATGVFAAAGPTYTSLPHKVGGLRPE